MYDCTIRRIVHKDTRYKFYLMRRGQFVSAKNSRTAIHSGKMNFKQGKTSWNPDMLWFYSDEKSFDQDPSDVSHVMHTKFPTIVKVLKQ